MAVAARINDLRAVWLLAVLAIGATAQAQRVRTIARVIATGDVDGRFAYPVCDGGRTLVPSSHAAFTYALARARLEGDDPMILDTGGLLTPHGVARYAAEARPSALATLVRALGYRALALGQNDLAAPRAPMLAVLRELRERGLPTIATNLRCAEPAQALCDVLVDASDGPSVHLAQGQRMAILSFLPTDATARVAQAQARGITLEPPAQSLTRAVRTSRASGVELVVAILDPGIGDPLALATSLPEDARPTLILVAGSSDILFARPRTVRPVVAGAPRGDALEVRIRESDETADGLEMLAQPLGHQGISADRAIDAWIDRVGEGYCRAWSRPTRGGTLERPLDLAGMLALTTRILRETFGADVAVINRQALDAQWRPAQPGWLSASDVNIALEYDDPVQVAEVDDAWLRALATRARDEPSLALAGLSGEGPTVGGQPLESRARYRVVSTHYLAASGQLPPLPPGQTWITLDDATARSAVLAYLDRPRGRDPRDTLAHPNGTLQWIFRGDATLSFSGSSITNPLQPCGPATPPDRCVGGSVVDPMTGRPLPIYDTSLLSRADTLTFGLDATGSIHAAAPDWTWQNGLSVVYRTQWIGTVGRFAEAADQIRARSTLSWRGLRQRSEHWYIPDPTVELFVESELTQPSSRTWHWLLTRPTLGLRFQLLDKLQLQTFGGLQLQPFDPTMHVQPGLGATLTLSSWDFLSAGDRSARLAMSLDYFVADVFTENLQQLRGELDAAFTLAGPLSLTLNLRIFLQQNGPQQAGFAIDATAGIRVGALARAVGP